MIGGRHPHFDDTGLVRGIVAMEMEVDQPVEAVGSGGDGVGFEGRAVEFEPDGFIVGVGSSGAPGVDVDAGGVGDAAD